MEAEIKAGAKLDMLTKGELQEVMDGLDFNVKIGRGLKFRTIMGQIPVVGNVPQEISIGPEPGFTWAVQSANVFIYDTVDPNANIYTTWYRNNRSNYVNMIFVVQSNGTGGTPVYFPKTAIIIHSGENMVCAIDPGAPTTVIPTLSYAINVIEVPTFSEGLLNL